MTMNRCSENSNRDGDGDSEGEERILDYFEGCEIMEEEVIDSV